MQSGASCPRPLRVSGDTNQAVATSNLALSKAADAESSSSAAAVAATRAEENAAGAATTTTIASRVHTAPTPR